MAAEVVNRPVPGSPPDRSGGAWTATLRPVEPVRVPCAGAVVRDRAGRLLLVRRGREPGRGLWSVPGGRVEPGESGPVAAVREVREETGLEVRVTRLAGVVERPGPNRQVYVIEDYVADLAPGEDPDLVRPGDDADAVGWFSTSEARRLRCVEGLLDTLAGWDVLTG